MDITVSWNITAISFTFGALLSALIAWRAFSVWQRQKANPVSEFFFKTLVFMTLYMGIRGLASIFFVHEEGVLATVYVISHVFLGIAMAYIARISVVSFFREQNANRVFLLTLFLFVLDVGVNLFFPNAPEFHAQTNIIDWGTQTVVAVFHTALLWGVFLIAAGIFLFKAFQNWSDETLRMRSLLIALGLISAIVIVIPRNIVESPLMIFISDIGFVVTFLLILLGVSYRTGEAS